MMFRRLIARLTMSDYEEARDRATKQIVSRYSRGNVRAQGGKFIEELELRRMSKAADAAMERLKKHIA